jgi:hypothetical protein
MKIHKPVVKNLPLQLPDSMSMYEKESREAEAKLVDNSPKKTGRKRAGARPAKTRGK